MNEDNNTVNENEELDNVITLKDEEGNEVKFEFLDLVELNDEESYISVEDEAILNQVFEIFKEKFKNDFDFVD